MLTDQQYIWTAATDIQKASGEIVWVDGTQIDPEAWSSGEPNNIEQGEETCVHFSGYTAKMYDARCSTAIKVICKVPESNYSCA